MFPSNLPIVHILVVLVASAASLMIYVSVSEQRLRHRVRARVRQAVAGAQYRSADFADAPSAVERALTWLLTRFGEYEQTVAAVRAAGFFSPQAATRFLLIRAGLAVAAPAATLAAAPDLGSQWPAAAVAAAAVGYLAPKLVLNRIAARRRVRLMRETPVFVDLVLLLVRSGISIEQSLRQISQLGGSSIPEIHRTLTLLLTDLDQGRDYFEALDRWAVRMVIAPGTDIARIFQHSMQQGVELSDSLSGYATRMIDDRMLEARALAGKRVTQTTVVMLIFLLPPLVVMIAAPGFTAVVKTIAKF